MIKFSTLKFLIFFIFCLLCLGLIRVAHAFDIQIYQKIISDSGLSFNTLRIDSNFDESKISENIKSFSKDVLLVESAQIRDDFLKNYLQDSQFKLIIFICNSSYEETKVFSCDVNSSIFSENPQGFSYESIKISDYGPKNAPVTSSFDLLKSENLNILILNERIFNQQQVKEDLIKFLASFQKSLKVKVENPSIQQNSLIDNLRSFYTSSTFAPLFYSLIVFIFYLFFGKIFIYLNSINFSIKKLSFDNIITLLDDLFFGVFKKNIFSKFFYLSVFVLFSVFIIQFLLSYNGSRTSYIKEFFASLINFNLFSSLSEKNYNEFVLFSLAFFMIYLVLFSRIGVLNIFLQRIFTNIKSKQINLNFLNNLVIFVILITSFLLLNFVNNQEFEFLFIFLVLAIFLVGIAIKNNLDLSKPFSLKMKILLSIVSVLFPIILYYAQSSTEVAWKTEPLIGISDKVVMLPYKKKLGEGFLIENLDYEDKLKFPIYVDEYLVFYPDKKLIRNRNIENFHENSNFTVVSKRVDGIFEAILKNPRIVEKLPKEIDSNLFYLNYFSEGSWDDLIKVTVDCENLSKKDFRYTLYYLDNSNNLKSIKSSKDLFLGCENDLKTFYFEKPVELIPGQKYIFSLTDFEKDEIKSIGIVSQVKSEETSSFSNVSKFNVDRDLYYYINSNSTSNNDTVYNYLIGDKKEFDFSQMSLSEAINALIKEKSVGNYFNLWTTNSFSLIKNEK